MNKFKKLDHIKSVIENSRDSANTNDTNNTQSYKLKLLELKKILDEELEKIYNEEIKKNVTNNLKLYLDTQDVKMNVYSHTEHLGSFANKQEIRIKNLLFKREFYGNILLLKILLYDFIDRFYYLLFHYLGKFVRKIDDDDENDK